MDQVLGNVSVLAAMPIFNLGLLIDGLLVGSIFALAAYGLALVWGVMNVKNLAQGDFIMIGGYLTWNLGRLGIDPLLGVPLAMVVLWGIGWVLYRTVISKVITRDLFTSLLATFGIAIVIQQGLNLAFGPDTQSAHADLPTLSFAGGLITIAATRIVGFVFAILLAVAVVLFMKKSRMGQAIRATAQDARAARVLGIDTEKSIDSPSALMRRSAAPPVLLWPWSGMFSPSSARPIRSASSLS